VFDPQSVKDQRDVLLTALVYAVNTKFYINPSISFEYEKDRLLYKDTSKLHTLRLIFEHYAKKNIIVATGNFETKHIVMYVTTI
jgi:hypothetical protein